MKNLRGLWLHSASHTTESKRLRVPAPPEGGQRAPLSEDGSHRGERHQGCQCIRKMNNPLGSEAKGPAEERRQADGLKTTIYSPLFAIQNENF